MKKKFQKFIYLFLTSVLLITCSKNSEEQFFVSSNSSAVIELEQRNLPGCVEDGYCTCTLNMNISPNNLPNGFSVSVLKFYPLPIGYQACFTTNSAGNHSIILDGGHGGMLPPRTYPPYKIEALFYSPTGSSPSLTVTLSQCVTKTHVFYSSGEKPLVPNNQCG